MRAVNRFILSAVAGLGVVLIVTILHDGAGSYGLGGPGFLGAMAAFVTWWTTSPKGG